MSTDVVLVEASCGSPAYLPVVASRKSFTDNGILVVKHNREPRCDATLVEPPLCLCGHTDNLCVQCTECEATKLRGIRSTHGPQHV